MTTYVQLSAFYDCDIPSFTFIDPHGTYFITQCPNIQPPNGICQPCPED